MGAQQSPAETGGFEGLGGASSSADGLETARWYQRWAWVLPFLSGLLAIFSGVYLAVYGRPGPGELAGFSSVGQTWAELVAADPGLAGYISQLFVFLGSIFVVTGLLVAVIAVTAFRRGERWAWYVLWSLPPLYLVIIGVDVTSRFPHLWAFYSVHLALVVLGLLLPIRQFFPAKGS